MFNYFHKNKFASQKGQLTPMFIVLIVIIVIMAMVTVNLGKVSLIKTDSSNAADAAGLSAGSAMANSFNSITVANSQMCKAYWSSYAAIAFSIGLALDDLILAQIKEAAAMGACPLIATTCAAIAKHTTAIAAFGDFELKMGAIAVAITAFYYKQYYTYAKIRENANLGRKRALVAGYSSAFSSSGIGSKLKIGSPPLKIGSPPADLSETQKHNYRDEFSAWIDNIAPADLKYYNIENSYAYRWKDGQNRLHSVEVKTDIQDVDSFNLKVSVLTMPEVIVLLAGIGITSIVVSGAMATAAGLLTGACGCFPACAAECAGPWFAACYPACLAACIEAWCAAADVPLGTATTGMIALDVMVGALLLGLLPLREVTSNHLYDPFPLGDVDIYAWIVDINHDRTVTVNTTQEHQGKELYPIKGRDSGFWQTNYPQISSYTKVDFRGNGNIGNFIPRHDASIIETDKL